ncbi:MAG: hypothetical protein HYV97_08960 [Bdellovibrio sp.]|nr:hypothetical protein [Bdellovibrio sp.]
MKELYLKLGEKTYRYLAVAFCFLGDLELSKYIYDKFTTPALFDKQFAQAMVLVQEVYKRQGVQVDWPENFKERIYLMVVTGVLLCLGIFIVFHLLNYTFFVFKKRFAHLYITMLSWSATFLAPLMGIIIFHEWPVYGTLFIIQGFLFFFVAWGLRIYPVPKAIKK